MSLFLLLVAILEVVDDVVEDDVVLQFYLALDVQLVMNVRDGECVQEEDDRITLIEELHVLADVLRVVEVLTCCIVEHQVQWVLHTFLGDGVDEWNLGLLVRNLGLCRKDASLEEDIVEVGLVSHLGAVSALVGYGRGEDAEVAQLAAVLAQLVDEYGDIVGLSTATGTNDGDDVAFVLYHLFRNHIVAMRADDGVRGVPTLVTVCRVWHGVHLSGKPS